MQLNNRTEILGEASRIFEHGMVQCDFHNHQAHEVLWVLDGRVRVQLLDDIVTLQKGDLLLIDSEVPHASSASHPNDLVLCFQHYFQDLSIHSGPSSNWSLMQQELGAEIKQQLAMLWWENQHKPKHWQTARDAALQHIQLILTRYFAAEVSPTKAQLESAQLVDQLLSTIRARYQQHLSLSQLAEEFELSEAYLSRYFKAKVGQSFLNYLTLLRLEKCLESLLQSQDAIGDIALNHGFPSIKAFNTAFKKEYHCTPSEFRCAQNKAQHSLVVQPQDYRSVEVSRVKQAIFPLLNKRLLYI